MRSFDEFLAEKAMNPEGNGDSVNMHDKTKKKPKVTTKQGTPPGGKAPGKKMHPEYDTRAEGGETVIDKAVGKRGMDEGVTIDTSLFITSHGKMPKGRGMWMFSTEKHPKSMDDDSVYVNASPDLYSKSAANAKKHFKEMDPNATVYVLP